MDIHQPAAISEVPEVTLAFWIIKIATTTLADFADRSLGIGCPEVRPSCLSWSCSASAHDG